MTTQEQKQISEFAGIFKDLEYIKRDIHEMKSDFKEFKGQYVTHHEFELEFRPIKRIVYGMVGIILSAILVAIINLLFTT